MRMWRTILITALAQVTLAAGPSSAQKTTLPDEAPLPEVLREADESPPLPSQRPVQAPAASDDAPRPAGMEPASPPEADDETDPRSGVSAGLLMPHAEIMCRQRLRAIGAQFSEGSTPAAEEGCALPYSVELEKLPGGTLVEPAAMVNCETALALADLALESMTPIAAELFSQPLAGIGQASGYVCRPRNGSTKLSEHAFGNAVDIASFRLAADHVIRVAPDLQGEEKAFVEQVRAAACGPFRTVLGPGSDADHADHLHLDLSPRRARDPICQ